jgi:chemotaxis protein methyltransferase CheR
MGIGTAPISSSPSSVPKDLIWLRDLIYKASGIFHVEAKFSLIERACLRRMDALDIDELSDYCEYLNSDPRRRMEIVELLNEITIGETCFFRNQPQLDALRDKILPEVMKSPSKLAFKQIRIWSAGCSTGEEPYTLAMLLLELQQTLLRGWSFEIRATDLNSRSIERAKTGVYTPYSLRNTAPAFKTKYFHQYGDSFDVRDEVRAKVKFEQLNLNDSQRMLFMTGFDVIFCCNVLIYFDLQSKKRVISHFYSNLLEGGYFFLGHSESLFGVEDRFRLVQFPATTGYWKAPSNVKC